MSALDKHILLIDDDGAMHHAVKLILEGTGYRVACCATGPAGLKAIRQEPPAVILLDIMLASPTEGFELAATLRNDEALRHIPIIMISSIGQRSGSELAQATGSGPALADRFLEKPFDAPGLLGAVQEVLDSGE